MKNNEILLLKYVYALTCCALGRYIAMSDFIEAMGLGLICTSDFAESIGFKNTTLTYCITNSYRTVYIYSTMDSISVQVRPGAILCNDSYIGMGKDKTANSYWNTIASKYTQPLYTLLLNTITMDVPILSLPMPIFNKKCEFREEKYIGLARPYHL